MCKIVKQRKKFFFLKKGKNLLTPNGKFLYAKSLKHANLLLNELKNKYKNNDQFSVLNLTFFSCNLSTSDKEKIKKSVLDLIYDDYVLYRRFSEKEIRKKMESSFDKFILCFSKKFKINLSLMSTISCKQKDLNLVLFLKFLDKLNIFELVVFYKLSKLTGSVILSFFFY